MHRVFSANADLKNDNVTISDKDEIHHLRHVLRLKNGDSLCLFNGNGGEAEGKIIRVSPQQVEVQIDTRRAQKPGKKIPVLLACAMPKKSKFELIIEKCTELGVDEIIPLITKRTEVRLDPDKAKKKMIRYQTVAVNAAKQSQRTTIPVIHPISNFDKVLHQLDNHWAAFIPHLGEKRKKLIHAFNITKIHNKVIFFIGPEGDFTPREISSAIEAGCIPVSLGSTVLKVETAAITVVALANLYTPLCPTSQGG